MVKRTKKMNFSKPILLLLFLALLVVVIVLIVKNNKNETFQGPDVYVEITEEMLHPYTKNLDAVNSGDADKIQQVFPNVDVRLGETLSITINSRLPFRGALQFLYPESNNQPAVSVYNFEILPPIQRLRDSRDPRRRLGERGEVANIQHTFDENLDASQINKIYYILLPSENMRIEDRSLIQNYKHGIIFVHETLPAVPINVFPRRLCGGLSVNTCPITPSLLRRVNQLLSIQRLDVDPCNEPDRYCVIEEEFKNVSNELWHIIERQYGDNPQNWPNDVQAVNLFNNLESKFRNWYIMADERCKDGLPRDTLGYPSDRPPAEVFGCRPDSRFEPPDVPRPTTPTSGRPTQAPAPTTQRPTNYRPCTDKETCQNSRYIKLYAPGGRSQLRTAEFKYSPLLGVKFTNIYSIPDACFSACTQLNTLDLTRIRNIGNVAFRDTYNLTEITIPFTVRDIGVQAFYTFGYRGLVKITFQRATRRLLNMIRKRTVVFRSNTINPNWANNSRLVIEFNQSSGRWVKVN